MNRKLEMILEAKEDTPNVGCFDPDVHAIRTAAHSFAGEFWDEVIYNVFGNGEALVAVYTTIAMLVERDRLYRLAYDLLYAFHIAQDSDTSLPVKTIGDDPERMAEFLGVFILFSQIILEDYADEIYEDSGIDIFGSGDDTGEDGDDDDTVGWDPECLETCVVCGKKTRFRKDEPIMNRRHYVEGVGQLCDCCYHKVYAK